jgi:hypothetical protein
LPHRAAPPRHPWPSRVELHTVPLPSRDSPSNLLPRPPESSPRRSFLCPGRDLTGAGRTTAGNGGRRRKTPPAPPPPQTPIEIESRDPSSRPPPVPGRSRPPVRQNLTGPPPAGARGLHCKVPSLSEGLSANRGCFCKDLKLLGTLLQKGNFNSICALLNLVNFVENRRKIRKIQTQFCWISGKK